MPTIDMVMPKMGESVQEGTVIAWKVKPGDRVEKDQILLDIATDKVDTEVPAPAAGIIAEILVGPDQTVEVGTPIARIETGTAAATPAETTKPVSAAPKPAAPSPVGARLVAPEQPKGEEGAMDHAPTTAFNQAPSAASGGATTDIPRRDGERFYSPLVRKLAREGNVVLAELRGLAGSGQKGRVTKADMLAYLDRRAAVPAAPPPRHAAAGPAPAPVARAALGEKKPLEALGVDPARVKIVKMNTMRKKIAEHMVESVHTSPHVYQVHEVDMTPVVNLRNQVKGDFEKEYGVKLTYTSFIVWAACRALRQNPMVNARINGDEIIQYDYVNFGLAVALPDNGLIVPKIKDAENMTIAGIQRKINDLSGRAREGKLAPDEMSGGTFTLTNMGNYGTLFGMPIISQPEVAIMGTGAIQQRPVIRDGGIAVRWMMYAALAFDHRLVDGALAGRFLNSVEEALESIDPVQLGFDRRKG